MNDEGVLQQVQWWLGDNERGEIPELFATLTHATSMLQASINTAEEPTLRMTAGERYQHVRTAATTLAEAVDSLINYELGPTELAQT